MKKFKMLLIAFSLLACSSFAFATEIEGKEKEILNVLNDVVAEKNTNFLKKFINNFLIKDNFLKVLDEKTLNVKNMTQDEFYFEIAKEIVKNKNYNLLKNKDEKDKTIEIKKNLIKKDDNKEIECFEFTIKVFLNKTNKIEAGIDVSRNEKIEKTLKIKTNLEESLKNEISKYLKNKENDENNLVKILDEVDNNLYIYKIKNTPYDVLLNSILTYFVEKIEEDESKNIEKTIKIITEENEESIKYQEITITYNPTNMKKPYEVEVKKTQLYKKNKDIYLKDVAFEGESGIDFSQLQEDLKDFMNGQYLYYVKNPYDTKNCKLKSIHLSNLKKKIVKSIRNFYKNREFLFLTENKIEAKDEFLCCEKYFIKKDEINNLKNGKEINMERIAFFYKEDKIYAKILNQQTISKISTQDVKEKKEIEKENKQIKKLSDFLTNYNFVKNGKIDEIKKEEKFIYNEFGKREVEVFYEKNLDTFLEEKIDEFKKKNLKSFNLVDNEQNLYEIKIKNNFEFEKKLLLESFKKKDGAEKIFKNFKSGYIMDNLLKPDLLFSLGEYLTGTSSAYFLTRYKEEEYETENLEFSNIEKKIYEEIKKNPDECYHKIELENFVNFNTKGRYSSDWNDIKKTKINRLTFHCFLFKNKRNKNNQNKFNFKLYLNEEKNEYLTYLYRKNELKNKIYQALYNIENQNEKYLYNGRCKIVEIDPETLEEKESLTLENFSNEISNKIDYDFEKEDFENTEFKLNNYYVINNTLKKNELQCKSCNIKFEKEKENPIEIKEDFNRNLAENLLKKVMEELEKNEFKEDNLKYWDYNTYYYYAPSYSSFKIDKKEFDEILTKENLLKDGKIEIFDVEKNKTISLTLDQFKILAKQTVLFFETRGPKIENIIKKNEHKSEEDEFLVNLHLDYDPENKTIKIKKISENTNNILYYNNYKNKQNNLFALRTLDICTEKIPYNEIFNKLKTKNLYENFEIKIFNKKEKKLKKYDYNNFKEYLKKEICKKILKNDEYMDQIIEIKIKNIVNNENKCLYNLILELYDIDYLKYDLENLKSPETVKSIIVKRNEEDEKEFKKQNFEEIEIKFKNNLLESDEYENLVTIFKNIGNFYIKNKPSIITKKWVLNNFVEKAQKVYVKNEENEDVQYELNKEDTLKIKDLLKKSLFPELSDKKVNKDEKIKIKKNLDEKIDEIINNNDVINTLQAHYINFFKSLKTKNKNVSNDENIKLKYKEQETDKTANLNVNFKIIPFPKKETLKNELDLSYPLLESDPTKNKFTYILVTNLKILKGNKMLNPKLVIVENGEKIEEIKKDFKEIDQKHENSALNKANKILNNGKFQKELKNLLKYKKFNNGEKLTIENSNNKMKSRSLEYIKYQIQKQLKKYFEEKKEDEQEEYEIKLKNVISNFSKRINDKKDEENKSEDEDEYKKYNLNFKIEKKINKKNNEPYFEIKKNTDNEYDLKQSEKTLRNKFNFNDLQSPGFIMPDVLYVTDTLIVQNCHNTSDEEEQIETLDDYSNEEYKEKIKNIKFNEEEKNLLNIFFKGNSSTYKSAEKNKREKFLEDFLTNLNEKFKNEFYRDLFYGSDTDKVNQEEKNFQYSFDDQSQNELESQNLQNQAEKKVFKIKLKATNCDVEKIKNEYKNKGKLFKYSTYKEVFKLEIEIEDEEKNETIFLKNRFIAPKICFERKDLIEGNLMVFDIFKKNPEEKNKENIIYDYEKLNEAADAIDNAFTEEINNKKDGFYDVVTKIFPDYNIKFKLKISKYGNIIRNTWTDWGFFYLTEEGKEAFIKTEKYNLNFFTKKNENKLKDLEIAENEKDLELIKNKIVNKLEEEDLIKLKKITLAGKTPYVIPLKLEIEYNNENEKAKYFGLEVYYSVSLKEFKVKNLKALTKEEFEEFKKNEKEEK